MSDFIRPAIKAVTSVDELTVGTKLYQVFGIWPPFVASGEYTVVRSPVPFGKHPECPGYSELSDSIVFDTKNDGTVEYHFASDGNISGHYNNNYWFKTKEDAEIYRAQCREDWGAHPDEIELVKEQRIQDALDDDFYDDYGDRRDDY